jgi:hypothetical protein
VQFRNRSGGIRSRRIAEGNDPGKFQRRWRTHRNGEHRKPLASSSFAVFDASGADRVSPATAAKAPLTARTVTPPASMAVASDIFVPGSNGTNLASLGRLEAAFLAAAALMAPSTGSCPPSELARAATR